MRPFFVRMTGKQIQETYAEEIKELEQLAQICDEQAEKVPEPEAQESDELDYGPITKLPSFYRGSGADFREQAHDLRRFSKWIDPEAVFDLGREDLYALKLTPHSFRLGGGVPNELLEKLQERRRQEH